VFPVFMSVVIVLKGIVLFKRGTIADKKVCRCLTEEPAVLVL
jgi:hypothetical protein